MKNISSPINKDLETKVEIAIRRASNAANIATSLQTTFVFRPGELNPTANVYSTWNTLYAEFSQVEGPKIIQFDDTLSIPVIPAGTYDVFNTILMGILHSGSNTICRLADGVIFLRLQTVANTLTLISESTTIPVFTFSNNDLVIIEKGGKITNDPASTVPFFLVPTGVVSPIIPSLVGGSIGDPGIHSIEVQIGASIAIALDIFASLANDIITGAGTALIIVTSQAAFINTPFPILQPAVGTLAIVIFQFANFISFQNLNNADWIAPPPANVEEAINRMSNLLVVLNGGPIP